MVSSEPDRERHSRIITVVNSIGPTSMPLNEFVLYRNKSFPDERHIILTLESTGTQLASKLSTESIQIIDCKNSIIKFVKTARSLLSIIKHERGSSFLAHLHHPRSAFIFQLARLFHKQHVPTLFTIHNMYDAFPFITKIISAISCIMADYVSFVSRASYRRFPLKFYAEMSKKFQIIPNGVHIDRIDHLIQGGTIPRFTNRGNAFPESFKLINVGRMVRQKNQRMLLHLVAQLDMCTLTLIGDGPWRQQLEKTAKDLGVIDRIEFTGIISREEVYYRMCSSDVFVSSSFWEGMPIAVLEAMALGLPVILSDIDPHREIACRGSSVKLVPFNTQTWIETIREFESMPKQLLADIGRRNRKLVEGHFSLRRMHTEYNKVYNRLQHRI